MYSDQKSRDQPARTHQKIYIFIPLLFALWHKIGIPINGMVKYVQVSAA